MALRGLADIISDLDDLKFLYPNISKECFKKSLPQVNKNDDDYYVVDIRAMLPEKEKSLLDNVSPEPNPNDPQNSIPIEIYPNGNIEGTWDLVHTDNGSTSMEPCQNGTIVLYKEPLYDGSSNPNSNCTPEPYSNGSVPNSETLPPNDGTIYMISTLNSTNAEDGQLLRHDNFSDSNSNSPPERYSNISEPNSSSSTPNDGTTYMEPTLNGTAVDDALVVEINELMMQEGIELLTIDEPTSNLMNDA